MGATFRTEGPCNGRGGLAGKLEGNSNGLVGERGRVGLWSIASMREPAGMLGGGSAREGDPKQEQLVSHRLCWHRQNEVRPWKEPPQTKRRGRGCVGPARDPLCG